MNKKYQKSLLAIACLAFSSLAVALPKTSQTASCRLLSPVDGEYDNSKAAVITSESAYKKLTQANQFYADNQHNQAIPILKDLAANSSDKAVKAKAGLILGRIYQEREQYDAAVNELKKVLASGDLGAQNEASIKQSLAFVYSGQNNTREALKWMLDYFKSVIKPPATSYAFLAQLYMKSNDYRGSICPSYLALQQGFKSKKVMYGFLFNAHYQIKDYNGAEVVAKEMIDIFPTEKSSYNNLFGIFQQQGKQTDMLALAELAYMNGVWNTETNYKQLSALYANNNIPLLAAERLKEGVDKGVVQGTESNWANIAQNFAVAKERENAIAAYLKAASYTSSGKHDLKVANMYYDQEKFEQALSNYNKALQKGGLSSNETGYAHLWKGVSYMSLKQTNNAIESFKRARNFNNVSKNAGQYIAFINQREQQKKALEEEFASVEQTEEAENIEEQPES